MCSLTHLLALPPTAPCLPPHPTPQPQAALIKQSCLDLINAHNDTFAKRSEITIIALIATEIVISLCGLHDLVPLRALLGGGGGGGGH